VLNGVVDNPAMTRFELKLGDELAAVYYRAEGSRLVLVHTEVPFEYSGQGIGSKLAQAVLEDVRRRGLKVVVKCPFFSAYIAKHPEYSDLIDG
jgi:predicted GNAT family acetyltransferase